MKVTRGRWRVENSLNGKLVGEGERKSIMPVKLSSQMT